MTAKDNNNYISAVFDFKTDNVLVWERQGNERTLVKHKAPYYFYIEDTDGPYVSLGGKKLARLNFDGADNFDSACRQHSVKYESDIAPLDKVLMNEYYGKPLPQINVSFLDIEVDYKSEMGWSSPENPYAPINAITLYHQWSDTFDVFAVPPPEWNGIWDTTAFPDFDFKSVVICKNEAELLTRVLRAIKDTDILSGWNSEFFDMPYLVKRTEIALGKEYANSWCFEHARKPKYAEVERYGSPHTVVRLSGRVHIDFMDLFKKFTFTGRSSYSLAAITNEELDQPKMEYEGTLEELFHNNFSHFVAYNKRDTESLRDLNKKFRLIELAAQMARENTVPMEAVLGTVKYVETGITNYAHNVMKVIVADKKIEEKHGKVEGAIVLTPKIGVHEWVGSVDIKSLYPSVIRALNISPEMIIGQFTQFEEDWKGIYEKDQLQHTLKFDGSSDDGISATGEEWNKVLRESKWAVSGYGTVFDQSQGKGILPSVLEFWYNERTRLQAEKKKWTKIADALKNDSSKIEEYEHAKKQEEHYDLLQLTKKIQLNSAYGALLNLFFRFGRVEMGASVTGSGRQITTHMLQTIGEILTGDIDLLVKETIVEEDGTVQNIYTSPNRAIIYSDTDSGYFATFANNVDDAVEIADDVASSLNSSFPGFMRDAFNCQPGFDGLISAGREVVGERALFQARKKYVIKVVDLEGFRCNKLKSQGSEIKKSDTPKIIQTFLSDVVGMILDGKSYQDIESFVNLARARIMVKDNLLALGVSKSVNNLDAAYLEFRQFEKAGIRRAKLLGGTRPAINYNEHVQLREGAGGMQIKSGDKVITYNLCPNPYGYTSISFSADISKLPPWFMEDFEVDMAVTEKKLFDAKLLSVFVAAGWDVPTPQLALFKSVFDF